MVSSQEERDLLQQQIDAANAAPDMISSADPRTPRTINVPTQVIDQKPEPGTVQMPMQTVEGSANAPPDVINSAGAIDQTPKGPLSNTQLAARQVEGLEGQKTLQMKEADNVAAGHTRAAEIQALAARLDAEKVAESKAMMDRAIADSNARDASLRAQIQKAQNERIDPERYWNSKSTEAKVLSSIGMMISGAGGGMTGSNRNLAVEQLNRAIDNDIDAQKHHIQNNWKAIADQHGIDSDAFNRDLHRQSWENNYRTSALERVKLQLAASSAATSSESVKNNASLAIANISNQQDLIRNKQYNLALAAAHAETARVRGLMKSANDDVMKLIEKEGVTPDEAEKRVFGQPMFRELLSRGIFPQSVKTEQKIHQAFNEELDATVKATGMPRAEAAKSLLEKPEYAPLVRSGEPIVPSTKGEKSHEIEARMVDVQVAPGKTIRKLAASKEEANIYREKTGAAQQWDAGVTKLQDLNNISKKRSLTIAEIAEWSQARADMIATYGVMKEGSKRLPNEAEKKNLTENVIGNPPIGYGIAPLINPSALPSVVDSRLKGLSGISSEARKSANLALTSKPPEVKDETGSAKGPTGPAKGLEK